ncbi:dynein regulatory complex protein 8-like [Neocloeon triangulifer]|uniref:dynein regulatory complex protein 8-like n=1 Tax=Neocloeon triangulifer TaxID=2078957 RepID=UPI00286F6149|nr:dynein regulatory complex protein 8-like [Neocloeon triangulifer]
MNKKEEASNLEKKINDAFKLFDHTGSDAVDVREIGTIIRSLGCCPSESELQEILVQVEDQEMTGSVKLNRFLPVMAEILQENRLQGAEPELLLAALKTFDFEGKGTVDPERLRELLTTEGEAFSQEEMDDMLAAAVDPNTSLIPYEDFVPKLMVKLIFE